MRINVTFYQTMVGSKSPLPSSTPVNHRPFISRNETFLLGRETRLPSSFPLSLVAPANPFWTLSWRTSDNNMHRRQASFGSISRLLYHSIALLGRNRVLLQVWKLDHENWITCSQWLQRVVSYTCDVSIDHGVHGFCGVAKEIWQATYLPRGLVGFFNITNTIQMAVAEIFIVCYVFEIMNWYWCLYISLINEKGIACL